MPKIYDVSPKIEANMAVYPGNPSPEIRRYASIPEDGTNESLICIGSHTGSHVDSRLHIKNDAESALCLPLDSFYGKCKVLDLTKIEMEIHKKNIEKYSISRGDIILIKTKNSSFGPHEFKKNFVHIKMDAAKYLVDLGIKTLGFDYLSVKKFGGDDDVHSLLINSLTLFEGLNLSDVSQGEYIFAGLPLKIDCDGAPARVLLIRTN